MVDMDALWAAANAVPPDQRVWHAWDRGVGWEIHHGVECGDAERIADYRQAQKEGREPRPFAEFASCEEVNWSLKETFPRTSAQFIATCDPATVIRLFEKLEELVDDWQVNGQPHAAAELRRLLDGGEF